MRRRCRKAPNGPKLLCYDTSLGRVPLVGNITRQLKGRCRVRLEGNGPAFVCAPLSRASVRSMGPREPAAVCLLTRGRCPGRMDGSTSLALGIAARSRGAVDIGRAAV